MATAGAVMLGAGSGVAYADAEGAGQKPSASTAEASTPNESAEQDSTGDTSDEGAATVAGGSATAPTQRNDTNGDGGTGGNADTGGAADTDEGAEAEAEQLADDLADELDEEQPAPDVGDSTDEGIDETVDDSILDGDLDGGDPDGPDLDTPDDEPSDPDSVEGADPAVAEPASDGAYEPTDEPRGSTESSESSEPSETPDDLDAVQEPEVGSDSDEPPAESAQPVGRGDVPDGSQSLPEPSEIAASGRNLADSAAAADPAPKSSIVMASATTPAPTQPSQNSFMAMLASLWREWNRIFSNAAPVLRSKQVTVNLADSTDTSEPISFDGVDADGDVLVYSVPSQGSTNGPKYGTVTIDQQTGTFVYNPDDDLTVGAVTDTFTVTVRDNGTQPGGLFGFLRMLSGRSATATFTVVVPPANGAPTAVDDAISGIANTTVTGNVLTNDSDREGQPLTAQLLTDPTHGTLTFDSDGSFTYIADEGFTGKDVFTYAASDGVTTSAPAKVTISMATVVDPNTPTVGVQGLSWWLGLSEADTNRALDMAKSAGVSAVRIDISWYVVEYAEDSYDWSGIDPLVDKITARDMDVLGMLYDTPSWLSGESDPHTRPDPELFAEFAADTALHYSGQIDSWEIWNEQNIPRFWDTPDPVAYTELLKAVYPAIKAVNPEATVITGGLSPDGSGIDPVEYIVRMYDAGAGGYFDAIALHPYAFPELPTLDSVAAVHEVMVAYGDGDKKIWLTEVGAPTGTSPYSVTEEMQAQSIAVVVDWARNTDYIGPVYLYSLLDTGSDPADPEDNFGLIRRDFTPKPAFGVWL